MKLHDALLVDGTLVQSLEYERSGDNSALVKLVLVGDQSARDSWKRFLKEHQLIGDSSASEKESTDSTNPLRSYWSKPIDGTSLYSIEIWGRSRTD